MTKVINMSNMFKDCLSLAELNANIFNASNVEDIFYMFDSFYLLNKLNISNFITKNSKI